MTPYLLNVSTIVLPTFAYSVLSFFGVFLVGHVVVSILSRTEAETRLFQKLTIGALAVATCYASIRSAGTTILLVNALLGIYVLARSRDDMPRSFEAMVKNLTCLGEGLWQGVLFLAGMYAYLLGYLFDFRNEGLRLLAPDYSFYARVAGSLRDFGIENRDIEYFVPTLRSTTLYHYVDLWLAALFSDVFNIHVQYALVLISFPILYTCVFLGLVRLVRTIKSSLGRGPSPRDYVLASTFFVTAMFGFLYPRNIDILRADVWVAAINGVPKLAVVYLYVIWIFIMCIEKRYALIGALASLLAVAYITVAPSVFLAVGSFYLYRLLSKRERLRETLINCLPLMFTTVAFLILRTGSDGGGSIVLPRESLLSYYGSPLALKTGINIVVKACIQMLITCSPYLVCVYLARIRVFKDYRNLALLLSLIWIFSLGTYATMHRMHDSVQLWSAIFMPTVNISAFATCTVLVFMEGRLPIARYYLWFILLMNVYDGFSNGRTQQLGPLPKSVKPEAMAEVRRLFGPGQSRLAYVRNGAEYRDYFSVFEQFYSGQTSMLMRTFDPLIIVCLSVDNVPILNPNHEQFIDATTFRKYTMQQRREGRFRSIERSRQAFVDDFSVDYLLVSRGGQLPSDMTSLFSGAPRGRVDGYSVYGRLK